MANNIYLTAKCSDLFSLSGFIDNKSINFEGYVPDFIGAGDYFNITIDTDTMEIVKLGNIKIVNGKLTEISKNDFLNIGDKN